MTTCANCGHSNPEASKFCRNCGTVLQDAAAPQAPSAAGLPPSAVRRRPSPSLQDSLSQLGLRPTCGQLAGFAAAVVFGLILARALPFVFPVFYPVLGFVFRDVLGTTPDAFNTAAITTLTCLGSFGAAFASTLLFGRRRRRS